MFLPKLLLLARLFSPVQLLFTLLLISLMILVEATTFISLLVLPRMGRECLVQLMTWLT